MHCLECGTVTESKTTTCGACGARMPSDAECYFRAGGDMLAAGDADLSSELLKDCVALDPDHTRARYSLGMALALRGKFDEAITHYAAIVERDPGFPGIHTALGQTEFARSCVLTEQAEAARDISVGFLIRAINEDPNDIDAHFSIAAAYVSMERPMDALPHLVHALALQPDSAAVRLMIAKVFKMLGRTETASAMATISRQVSEPDDPFWNDIDELLAGSRDSDSAI